MIRCVQGFRMGQGPVQVRDDQSMLYSAERKREARPVVKYKHLCAASIKHEYFASIFHFFSFSSSSFSSSSISFLFASCSFSHFSRKFGTIGFDKIFLCSSGIPLNISSEGPSS